MTYIRLRGLTGLTFGLLALYLSGGMLAAQDRVRVGLLPFDVASVQGGTPQAAEAMAKLDPRFVQWGYAEEDYEMRLLPAYREGQTRQVRCLKDNAKLVPDGIAYDRLIVVAFGAIKMQKAKIAEQDTEMRKLRARLDKLEKAA